MPVGLFLAAALWNKKPTVVVSSILIVFKDHKESSTFSPNIYNRRGQVLTNSKRSLPPNLSVLWDKNIAVQVG